MFQLVLGLVMIAGGIGVSVWSYNSADAGESYRILWGLPVIGAITVCLAIYKMATKPTVEQMMAEAPPCQIDEAIGENRYPVVFIPARKLAAGFDGRIPRTLDSPSQQNRLSEIIRGDLGRDRRGFTGLSQQDAWTIEKWQHIQVLMDDSGENLVALAIHYDDGRFAQSAQGGSR